MDNRTKSKKKSSKSFKNQIKSRMIPFLNAKRNVLKQKSYLISFIGLSVFMSLFLLLLPGLLNPENSLVMQLSLLKPTNYALIIALGVLISLLIVMQFYSYKNAGSASYGKTALSGGSAFFAAVVGTAGCASCVATAFAFLGFGASAFLVKHQLLVMGIAILVVIASLYFTSLKISGECTTCRIK